MNEEFDYHLPYDGYIITCLEGYIDFGFDRDILDKALKDTKENMGKKLIK